MISHNQIRIRKYFKYTAFLILILFTLFWTGLILYRNHLQNKIKEKYEISAANGIDTLIGVNLGGSEQWCLIRGWDRFNPVLLYLHGGPGGPLFPRARTIGTLTNLEKHFVVVYWEQRGTGKSYHSDIPIETMTIDQFVDDLQELSRLLIAQFNAGKIYLLGTSWGSLIGLLAAHETPELFNAFIGVGQLITPLESDRASYQFCLKTAINSKNGKAIEELEKIGPPPYTYQQLIIQRKWLSRFEKIILPEKGIRNQPEFNTIEKLLSTPEYSIVEILQIGLDPYFSLKHLWNDELYQINLFDQVPEINIPVYVLMGMHDYITPAEIAEEYYEKLSAPKGKDLTRFEKSGHEPYFHEPGKFLDVMITILKETHLNEPMNRRK